MRLARFHLLAGAGTGALSLFAAAVPALGQGVSESDAGVSQDNGNAIIVTAQHRKQSLRDACKVDGDHLDLYGQVTNLFGSHAWSGSAQFVQGLFGYKMPLEPTVWRVGFRYKM